MSISDPVVEATPSISWSGDRRDLGQLLCVAGDWITRQQTTFDEFHFDHLHIWYGSDEETVYVSVYYLYIGSGRLTSPG